MTYKFWSNDLKADFWFLRCIWFLRDIFKTWQKKQTSYQSQETDFETKFRTVVSEMSSFVGNHILPIDSYQVFYQEMTMLQPGNYKVPQNFVVFTHISVTVCLNMITTNPNFRNNWWTDLTCCWEYIENDLWYIYTWWNKRGWFWKG